MIAGDLHGCFDAVLICLEVLFHVGRGTWDGSFIFGGCSKPKSDYLDPWYGPTEELVGLYLSQYWASES